MAHVAITNEEIKAHAFLADMYANNQYPRHLVDKAKAILLDLCAKIEAKTPKKLDDLYDLTHRATDSFNDLQDEFKAKKSKYDAVAALAACGGSDSAPADDSSRGDTSGGGTTGGGTTGGGTTGGGTTGGGTTGGGTTGGGTTTPAATPWPMAADLVALADGVTTIDLNLFLPAGVARGGRFALASTSAALPAGLVLQNNGLIQASSATQLASFPNIVFTYEVA